MDTDEKFVKDYNDLISDFQKQIVNLCKNRLKEQISNISLTNEKLKSEIIDKNNLDKKLTDYKNKAFSELKKEFDKSHNKTRNSINKLFVTKKHIHIINNTKSTKHPDNAYNNNNRSKFIINNNNNNNISKQRYSRALHNNNPNYLNAHAYRNARSKSRSYRSRSRSAGTFYSNRRENINKKGNTNTKNNNNSNRLNHISNRKFQSKPSNSNNDYFSRYNNRDPYFPVFNPHRPHRNVNFNVYRPNYINRQPYHSFRPIERNNFIRNNFYERNGDYNNFQAQRRHPLNSRIYNDPYNRDSRFNPMPQRNFNYFQGRPY